MKSVLTRVTWVLVLGGCAASPPCPSASPVATDPADDEPSAASVSSSVVRAHDVAAFSPPFEPVPFAEAYARTHRIRQITVHQDNDAEGVRYRDVDIDIHRYDEEGRPLGYRETSRGNETGSVVFRHDEAGRLVEKKRLSPGGKTVFTETYDYDGDGRLLRTVSVGHETTTEERSYDRAGRLLKETWTNGERNAVREHRYENGLLVAIEGISQWDKPLRWAYRYDADERLVGLRQETAPGRVDAFRFDYAPNGQLRSLSFVENDAPIYTRTYRYDEEGLLIEERLESFVPAMGEGQILRYVYERHGDPVVRPSPPALPPPEPRKLVSMVLEAWPGAYADMAQATFETNGKDHPWAHSVRVHIPEAKLERVTNEMLKQRICAAPGNPGDCGCMRIEREPAWDAGWSAWPDKRVVPVRVLFGPGC